MNIIQRQKDKIIVTGLLKTFPIINLIGPRQCGKTTFTKQLDIDNYYNLSYEDDRAKLGDAYSYLSNLKGIVVLDEIQSKPDLLQAIRQIVDEKDNIKFIITGSLPLFHIPNHLIGRVFNYEINGFSLSDVGLENIEKLLFRGGFPNSYLSDSDENSLIWRDNYLNQNLHDIIVSKGYSLSPHIIKKIWFTISKQNGYLINYSQLSIETGLNTQTLKNYIDILSSMLMIRLLSPYNFGKRNLLKSQKIYIRDSGLLISSIGFSSIKQVKESSLYGQIWESYVLNSIINCLDLSDESIFFWRNKNGQELDFLWIENNILNGIEIVTKFSEQYLDKYSKIKSELGLNHIWIIHDNNDTVEIAENITVLSLKTFINSKQSKDIPEEKAIGKEKRKLSVPIKKVFISYSHNDDIFIQKLVKNLDENDIQITIDYKTLRFGDDIEVYIKKGIRGSDYTIIVISENSLRSPWVMAEFLETIYYEYSENRKRLLPINIDNYIYNPNINIDISKDIQQKIEDISNGISDALKMKIDFYDQYNIYQRLLIFQSNLSKALDLLRSVLIGNFTSADNIKKNLPLLIEELKT